MILFTHRRRLYIRAGWCLIYVLCRTSWQGTVGLYRKVWAFFVVIRLQCGGNCGCPKCNREVLYGSTVSDVQFFVYGHAMKQVCSLESLWGLPDSQHLLNFKPETLLTPNIRKGDIQIQAMTWYSRMRRATWL